MAWISSDLEVARITTEQNIMFRLQVLTICCELGEAKSAPAWINRWHRLQIGAIKELN
jgi:hypothetical protein